MNYSYSIRILLLLMCVGLFSFNADAQKRKKKKEAAAAAAKKPKKAPSKKGGIQPYDKVITKKAVSDEGLMTTHRVGSKYYFELPNDLLEKEILVVSRVAGTVKGLSFGGAGMKSRPQQVIRWQRHNNKVLMRSVSYSSVANFEDPIYQSVKRNNFEPIVMSFDIKAISKDSALVIDVEELFLSDVQMIGGLSSRQRKNFGIKMLDKKRCLINSMKSFPENVNVKHIMTYKGSKLPANGLTGSLSLEMAQSFILLPKEPMQPRLFDARVGYFSIRQTNYSADEQKAATQRFITRWRLEPKDEAAFKRGELVEPVKQIIYYIDPATPPKWIPYLKKGIEDWQPAFEKAGFKNAIIAKEAPTKEEDPEWTPEDVRYSVIRYITTDIQNAQGPHVHDPRTGEILESDILWYHNIMNLLRNWYFIQTAAGNPDARSVKFKQEVMGELIRFVAAHEVGHTLGLPHNMGASSAYPVDSLRSAHFTHKMGTAPSIMDYARFNYIAQPEDKGVHLYPNVGIYDKYSIEWGYRPILDAKTSAAEKKTLDSWILAKANDPLYRFGQQMGNPLDPTAQTEDLGDDAMKASMYGIKNLKRIVPNLIKWTKEDGKDYADLAELYGQVLGQWGRYAGHVKTNIGGVYRNTKTYEQEGVVYTAVPRAKQKEAVQFLHKELFETPTWLIDSDILRRFESAGTVNRIGAYQVRTLNDILDPSRLARLLESEAVKAPVNPEFDSRPYKVEELFTDMRGGIWSELKSGSAIDPYRRQLQRAYVERLEFLMKEEQQRMPRGIESWTAYTRVDVSRSDIRPIARAELKILRGNIKNAKSRIGDSMSKYHLEDLEERIKMILEPK